MTFTRTAPHAAFLIRSGEPVSKQATNNSLPERSRRVLEHVARHRLTTYPAVQQSCLSGMTRNAVVKLLNRLCRDGHLQKVPLQAREQYFVLTPTAARLLGVSVKRTGPLGVQSLATESALLYFATTTSRKRRRLTTAEMRTEFPCMPPGLIRLPHCLDESKSDSPCLELVRVDLGGKADHVARKCETDIDRRRDLDGFKELLERKQFRLVVITTTKPKFDAIRHALDQHVWPEGMEIHVAVLPRLLSLLGGSTHAS